jgi:nucleotide-binding universal stress UspA family protein
MYERILIAIDGSEDAQTATEHAVDLAGQYGAELHCLYVIETRTAYDNAIVEPETVRKSLQKEGEDALAAVEAKADEDTAVAASIREGVPSEEILTYCDEHGIDLVVMGAKGKSTFKTILLGSTTEAVLRSGPPVMVVGEQED